MPLQLGGVETERPQTIVWNPMNALETQESSARMDYLKKQGFVVDDTDWNEGIIKMSPPPRDPNFGVMRILSDNGDDRVVWDRRLGNEVKEAFKKFTDFIKRGYTAYAVNAAGQRGHKIDQFNPALEEIIMAAKEIVMVPSTMPG